MQAFTRCGVCPVRPGQQDGIQIHRSTKKAHRHPHRQRGVGPGQSQPLPSPAASLHGKHDRGAGGSTQHRGNPQFAIALQANPPRQGFIEGRGHFRGTHKGLRGAHGQVASAQSGGVIAHGQGVGGFGALKLPAARREQRRGDADGLLLHGLRQYLKGPDRRIFSNRLQARMVQQALKGVPDRERADFFGENVFVQDQIAHAAPEQIIQFFIGAISLVEVREAQKDFVEVLGFNTAPVPVDHSDAIQGNIVFVERVVMGIAWPQGQGQNVRTPAGGPGIFGDRLVGALPRVQQAEGGMDPKFVVGQQGKHQEKDPPPVRASLQKAGPEEDRGHGEEGGHQQVNLVGLANHGIGRDQLGEERPAPGSAGIAHARGEQDHAQQAQQQQGGGHARQGFFLCPAAQKAGGAARQQEKHQVIAQVDFPAVAGIMELEHASDFR